MPNRVKSAPSRPPTSASRSSIVVKFRSIMSKSGSYSSEKEIRVSSLFYGRGKVGVCLNRVESCSSVTSSKLTNSSCSRSSVLWIIKGYSCCIWVSIGSQRNLPSFWIALSRKSSGSNLMLFSAKFKNRPFSHFLLSSLLKQSGLSLHCLILTTSNYPSNV